MISRHTPPADDECLPYYHAYIALVPEGDIMTTLEQQPAMLRMLVGGISDARAAEPPAPGEWSIKQVLIHLNDTERLFSFRALWFARGEQSPLPGMEPDPWVAAVDANTRPLADVLAEFAHLRAATDALFANLGERAWMRRGIASGAETSVRALAWLLAGHLLHHERSLREVFDLGN